MPFMYNQHGTPYRKVWWILVLSPTWNDQRQSCRFDINCDPQTTSHTPPIDLMFEIERETMNLGFQTSEIERWIVDDEAAADYEEDHWMNLRPY